MPPEKGSLTLVDRSGVVKRRSRRRNIAWYGVAWTPDGREVWFNASETGLDFAVHAMTVDGRERVVLGSMGAATVSDIARDGRALMVHERARGGMISVRQNETRERDLSWLDFSRPQDLLNDGKVVLFTGERCRRRSLAGRVREVDRRIAGRAFGRGDWRGHSRQMEIMGSGDKDRSGVNLCWALPTGAGQTRVFETGTSDGIRQRTLVARRYPSGIQCARAWPVAARLRAERFVGRPDADYPRGRSNAGRKRIARFETGAGRRPRSFVRAVPAGVEVRQLLRMDSVPGTLPYAGAATESRFGRSTRRAVYLESCGLTWRQDGETCGGRLSMPIRPGSSLANFASPCPRTAGTMCTVTFVRCLICTSPTD